MRRFSTSAASARSRLAGFFQQPPIADELEMQTLRSVQRLMEQVPTNPAPTALAQGGAYRSWLDGYRSSNGLSDSLALVDKDGYSALFDGAVARLKEQEAVALDGKPKIAVLDEAAATGADGLAYVEAIKLKLARHMCTQAGGAFELLDKDKDGKVEAGQVNRLLRVVEQGNTPEWLRSQFELYDSDADDAVTEAEAKLILDSIIATQKAVVSELFETHVDNMPKKHMKVVAKGLTEEDWKSKINEKVRCSFHFADKGNEEGTIVPWDAFKDSQESELPELHRLLGVYAKGIYDDRHEFYDRKRERRSTRIKGLLLATMIGVGDYVATVV